MIPGPPSVSLVRSRASVQSVGLTSNPVMGVALEGLKRGSIML